MPVPSSTRIAGLVGVGLANAALIACRRSTAAQGALDARTRRRLQPLAPSAATIEAA